MQLRDQHHQRLALAHGVLAADDRVGQGLDRVRRRRGPQPQALVENLADVGELADVRVLRVGVGRIAPQGVHFRLGAGQHRGVLGQVVQSERQQATGGLMAGDEEGDRLVADVDVVQGLAGDLVASVQHPAQQVVGALVAVRPALPDHIVDQVLHQGDVVAELLRLLPLEQLGPGDGLALGLSEVQCPRKRRDEGMRLITAEGFEVVAEAAQPDRVEGQPGHVGGHVHRKLPGRPVPLGDQLTGDLEHRRVVTPHRAQGERRHQDVVRLAPVGLVAIGREQPVSADLPQDHEVGVNVLAEPALVRQFGDEIQAGDEVDLGAEDPELEQRPQLLGLLHDIGETFGPARDVECMADQGKSRALGDRLGFGQGRRGHERAFRSRLASDGRQPTGRHCRVTMSPD